MKPRAAGTQRTKKKQRLLHSAKTKKLAPLSLVFGDVNVYVGALSVSAEGDDSPPKK